MKQLNFLTILFLLLLLTTPVFALTYVGSGEWNDYTSGLSSAYYRLDTTQSIQNRDFSDNFSITSSGQCVENWCATASNFERYNYVKVTDNNLLQLWSMNYIKPVLVFAATEIITDTLVSFDFNAVLGWYGTCGVGQDCASHFYYGYVDDYNNFTSVGQYNGAYRDDIVTIPWTNVSYKIPSGVGKYRVAFLFNGGSIDSYAWIDNIIVSRNNVGTFRNGFSAPNCSSINSCSNISSADELKSNANYNLYWITDYVANADCSVYENDVYKGKMTEMSNGLYYYKIESLAPDGSSVDVNLRAICDKVPYLSKGFATQLTIYDVEDLNSSLTTSNSLFDDTGAVGDLVTFYADYKDEFGDPIINADCNISVGGIDLDVSYSSGKYQGQWGFISQGIYEVETNCDHQDFSSQEDSYNISIGLPVEDILTFEAIENIDSYDISDFSTIISINPKNSVDDIVFSVINKENAYEILFEWFNLSKSSTQQYSVYTSSNGTDWVVDETINFGSSATYDDPIQKIPRANQHYYSFEDTLPNAEKVYYKIVYNQLPLAWQTIANSNDWVNINQPLVYTDANNYKWDWYADSNYTPIYSYTSKRFPELITSDFETGFELQFTAFSSSATTLQVGYVIGTTKSVVDVPISTKPNRYSVPIDPSSSEARLLITSEGNNSEVYLTDYAIVPRAYFAGRLNVYNRDGSTLNAIVNEGVSKTYLREGVPFIFETSAYDRDGDLQRLNVQALIGGIVIKSQDFYLSDATKKDKVFTWYETIEGFVDLNGNYINPVGMRDVQIQATLYNTANESVSVQTSTYKILQYPYFQNDLVFNLFSVNAKVGESPKVRFSLQQQDPSQFVGFRVFIYDGEHSIADPNYETTILNDVLNCNSFNCAKELEFTEYVYDANQNYRIAFLILLKTENESYTNPLTLKVYNQLVTYRTFETARILQVFERTDRTYRNDEKIQLVVQLRDEPYKNLLDDTSVYLTIDICSNDVVGEGCSVFGETKFYPKSKIYDETTGYNYYFFDQLFYDDSGNLLPDGNYIRFQAHISDQRYAHRVADIPIATLGDKCATGYGTLFNYSIFTMNFWKNLWTSSERALFGCTTYSSEVISLHDAEEKRILIDADHNVGSGQNHSIACLKVDNENFQNTLEQDLVCAVFWNRNEQSVDKFVFTLGNEFSDYAKSGAEQQYMKFEVPAELIIFNDAFMLQQSLNAEYQTDTIDTLGEVVFYGFDKLFSGIANPLVAIPEGLTRTGLITNVGFDINFSNAFDPTYVKGLYFFKIQGLKVINQYDYINQYPDLERLNPKYFTKFAIDNKIKLPVEDTIVRIYTNDLASFQPVGEQLDALKVRSPLIIFAERSKQQGADGNFIQSITTLRFNLISDMLSNNQTQTQRNFIPFVFSYVVPAKTGFFEIIDDILYGTDGAGNPAGLFTNPVGFGFKNWFWFVIILVFLLIASLILKNMRSNGGQITIPVITPFLENMHTNKVYKRGR